MTYKVPPPEKGKHIKGPKCLKSLLFSLANGAPPPCLALPLSLEHSHHPGVPTVLPTLYTSQTQDLFFAHSSALNTILTSRCYLQPLFT